MPASLRSTGSHRSREKSSHQHHDSKCSPENICSFLGNPLLEWSISAAFACRRIDQVVISADDPAIAQLAINPRAEVPFLKSAEPSTDTSPVITTALHALDQIPHATDVLLLQSTSPLRNSDDIEAMVKSRE